MKKILAALALGCTAMVFVARQDNACEVTFTVDGVQYGKTLEVNLATYAYAYIRPYIKGVDPGASVPWKQHVYYTFEFLYI